MTASVFGALIVAATLAFGIVPARVAYSRRALFLSDAALLLLPPIVLYASGRFLNPPLELGFGLIVYPFLALVAAVTLFYVRVFILDGVRPHPLSNSFACLMIACALAAVIGTIIPPLAE